ncbi:Nn.00g096990.m01.CDS01 [Neocucurbitaria sp. VM-36]
MDTVLSFLVPSAQGVRSRRHRVVLRRAEMHLQVVTERLSPTATLDHPVMDEEEEELVRNKILLVQQAIAELDEYAARHPRTRIGPKLELIRHALYLAVHLFNDCCE